MAGYPLRAVEIAFARMLSRNRIIRDIRAVHVKAYLWTVKSGCRLLSQLQNGTI